MDIDVCRKKEKINNFICAITLINKGARDIRNIILDIYIPQEVELIRGEIQRQRGILDIEGEYKNLIIGNLVADEVAKVTLEVKAKEENTEIECYGVIRKDKK